MRLLSFVLGGENGLVIVYKYGKFQILLLGPLSFASFKLILVFRNNNLFAKDLEFLDLRAFGSLDEALVSLFIASLHEYIIINYY